MVAMGGDHTAPEYHFVHQQASHFVNLWYFYAFGNIPPTDLLQYIPHDAVRADVLCLGCGDLRDLLYSLVLHGRRGVGGELAPRHLSFTLNDWEPAVHARNLVMLQMFLDSRNILLEARPSPAATGLGSGVESSDSQDGSRGAAHTRTAGEGACGKNGKANGKGGPTRPGASDAETSETAFAQRIGVIFSAMYNSFVDADVLEDIQDTASRLATAAASAAEWASTELGRHVRFADDRSQDRVRELFRLYADGNSFGPERTRKVKRERSAFVQQGLEQLGIKGEKTTLVSRSWGLARAAPSQSECDEAYGKMTQRYMKDGVLDPFPLLRAQEGAGAKRRGSPDRVNPLLLVTERKGLSYTLHYAAFPLDAFHTDVAWWKLREDSLQDEYGKLAPPVSKYPDFYILGCKEGTVSSATAQLGMQTAWFSAALEELSQMCGAFLEATAPSTPRLSLIIHAGEALNFCDALVVASPPSGPACPRATEESGDSQGEPRSPPAPIMFQQYTLQPLQLRAETLGCFADCRPAFDVVNTSNLAEHLGIVNLLVGSTPLLSESPHAVLLTSLMREVSLRKMYLTIDDFYKKSLCMSAHTAAVLLGVTPVSGISAVVDHMDTTAFVRHRTKTGLMPGDACLLRLTWKRPALAFSNLAVTSKPVDKRLDISPSDFAHLTLPVYKEMNHYMLLVQKFISAGRQRTEEMMAALATPRHYTPLSFARLVAAAGRQLRLGIDHHVAALDATIEKSGFILASNFQQEQFMLFDALDLAPIRQAMRVSVPAANLATQRVVLLLPESALSLMREFKLPQVYLSIATKENVAPGFDNHFLSLHMAYVRVRRGRVRSDEDGDDWQSLNDHLHVRDTNRDDPEAELMVSAVIPGYAVTAMPPEMVKLELRPRENHETVNAPKATKRRMKNGGGLDKYYRACLSDRDRIAVMSTEGSASSSKRRAGATRPLVCPPKVARDRRIEAGSSPISPGEVLGTPKPAVLHRIAHGEFLVDQSVQLVSENGRFKYRVTVVMANDRAKGLLATDGVAPIVEETVDHCSVRIKLGGGLMTHETQLPFPVNWKSAHIKFSKKQGYLVLTIPPAASAIRTPFVGERVGCGGEDVLRTALPSSWCFPICPSLRSMPRLDLAGDWSTDLIRKVFGDFSISQAEQAADGVEQGDANAGFHQGLLQLKRRLRWLATEACKQHKTNANDIEKPLICFKESGKPALWVWISNVLVDSSNEALVLDCCVMPAEDETGDRGAERSGILGTTKNLVIVEVDRSELELWMTLLPVVVERARQTYVHAGNCAYSTPKTSPAGRVLCDCGKGNDLPSAFVESLGFLTPAESENSLHRCFYRAALSPLYNAPRAMVATKAGSKAAGTPTAAAEKCAKCAKAGAALRCSRCRKVSYCSKECQRAHWKSHKAKCG